MQPSEPGRRPFQAPEPVAGGLSASPHHITATEHALRTLAALIAKSPHNLVSRRDRSNLRATHIEECVQVGRLLPIKAGSRWVDLGTGGGLPGLVLAVLYPEVGWMLVDATTKKAEAVAEFATQLQLNNVTVVAGRAEDLAHQVEHRAAHDGVVCRAVAGLSTVMELSRGFLGSGGWLAAIKGPRVQQEMPRADVARRLLRFGDIHTKGVSGVARPTVLVTMPALGPPPASFPRRVGVPAADPLGGVSA